MEITILRDFVLILLIAKCLGLLAQKVHIPQVVGEIVAGILLGPALLNWVKPSDFLMDMAEIGVLVIMFIAGLQTNFQQIMRTGLKSIVIALGGVLIPFIGGYLIYSVYYGFGSFGGTEFVEAMFMGVILMATSVALTVSVLAKIGHLEEEIGNVIKGAAVFDDLIGMIVLTVVLAIKNPANSPIKACISTLAFLCTALVVGFVAYKVYQFLIVKFPNAKGLPVIGLVVCFLTAYCAGAYFNLPDITGAYIAGIIICSLTDEPYIGGDIDESAYMLFAPVFFASIGVKAEASTISISLLLFALLYAAVALVCKIIGCAGTALAVRYKFGDSLKIGCGMMIRGEVALVVAQRGVSAGIIKADLFTPVIVMIIVSMVVTPLLMKLSFYEPAVKVRREKQKRGKKRDGKEHETIEMSEAETTEESGVTLYTYEGNSADTAPTDVYTGSDTDSTALISETDGVLH